MKNTNIIHNVLIVKEIKTGKKLEEIKKSLNVSGKEMGLMLGYDENNASNTFSQIKRGQKALSMKALKSLIVVQNSLNLNWFFYDIGEMWLKKTDEEIKNELELKLIEAMDGAEGKEGTFLEIIKSLSATNEELIREVRELRVKMERGGK